MEKNFFCRILTGFIFIISLSVNSHNDSTQRISLSNRKLVQLPEDINFQYLKQLDVRYNKIKSFPNELLKATGLEELDVSGNADLYMPAFNAQVKQLNIKKLSVNNCNLMCLPLEYGNLRQLKYLSLANNYITSISEDYALNPGLTYLDLSGNKIRLLPKEFEDWTSLQYLNLSANPCLNSKEAYQTISKLSGLEELVLRNAAWLDQSVFFLPNLKHLDISNGTFEKLELNQTKTMLLQKLTIENCNSFNFSSIEKLLSQNEIKELSLGGNLFYGFNNMQISTSIQKLKLSGNELTAFKLKSELLNLNSLELKFNKITCLPELMAQLSGAPFFKHLNLSACNITVIPQGFGKLEQLETLNLSMNKFDNITALYSLNNLKELNVSGCELNAKQLEKLREHLPGVVIINTMSPKLSLPGTDVSKETFSIDPSVVSKIITSNGTEIKIPSGSLIYPDGKPVTEPVTINYNSFYSLASIVSSGIHMNYPVNNEMQPFRSAGMFELTARAGEQQVQLKPGKKIDVNFKSLDSTTSYNYYQYDSIKQTWKETGKDSIQTVKFPKKETGNRDSVFSVALAQAFNSTMPVISNFYKEQPVYLHWKGLNKERRLTFSISTPLKRKKIMLDTNEKTNYLFEIEKLSGNSITWVVAESNLPAFKQKCFKENKLLYTESTGKKRRESTTYKRLNKSFNTSFELIPDRERDDFVFRFYNEKDTFEFHAYPDFRAAGRDVSREQKRIKKMYDEYALLHKNRLVVSAERKRRFKALYDLYMADTETQRKKLREMDINTLNEGEDRSFNNTGFGVTRFMSVSGFGFHNCDHPLSIPESVILAANFVDDDQKEIEPGLGNAPVFVDVKSNVCIAYSARSNRLPSNTILTVVVSGKNKLYLGKYSTLGKSGSLGKEDIKLTEVQKGFTFSDLEQYIATNP